MMYEYWFANIPRISTRRKIELRARCTTAQALYYIEETQFRGLEITQEEGEILKEHKKHWQLEKEYQKCEKKGVQPVFCWQEHYPNRLHNIASPPYVLYVKGRIPRDDQISVAIVGARECTPYGSAMASRFAKELAECGVQIISGMARGIDGASQWGALERGVSYAVLGSGVDVCYPREHIELYTQLERCGGILSEQPLGMMPLPQNFPARNRLISGLADIVLVIEAKERSGSLITADMALEQGKEVYAMPGPVDSRLSKGCHMLIKQGAGILISPENLIEELGLFSKNKIKNEKEEKIVLERKENMVYSCLTLQSSTATSIAKQIHLDEIQVLDALISLELKGLAREITKNHYIKIK